MMGRGGAKMLGNLKKQITEDIFQHTELCSTRNTLTVLTAQGKKSADKLGLGLTYLINLTFHFTVHDLG